MNSFGLIGDAATLSEKNEVCPKIRRNCCGKDDQIKIQEMWNSESDYIARHYSTYLLVIKYILGFSEKYSQFASIVIGRAPRAGVSKQ